VIQHARPTLVSVRCRSSDQPYRVSSSCRYPPGGGPTSIPSTSTQACASLSFGSRGSPITSSGWSPCSCRRRNKTRDVYKHRARHGPTRRTLETILPSRRGSACVEDKRRGCFNRSMTAGNGRRLTPAAIRTNSDRVCRASAPLRSSGSLLSASSMTLPSADEAPCQLRRASVGPPTAGARRPTDDAHHGTRRVP
jgi:hypothetical protein